MCPVKSKVWDKRNIQLKCHSLWSNLNYTPFRNTYQNNQKSGSNWKPSDIWAIVVCLYFPGKLNKGEAEKGQWFWRWWGIVQTELLTDLSAKQDWPCWCFCVHHFYFPWITALSYRLWVCFQILDNHVLNSYVCYLDLCIYTLEVRQELMLWIQL